MRSEELINKKINRRLEIFALNHPRLVRLKKREKVFFFKLSKRLYRFFGNYDFEHISKIIYILMDIPPNDSKEMLENVWLTCFKHIYQHIQGYHLNQLLEKFSKKWDEKYNTNLAYRVSSFLDVHQMIGSVSTSMVCDLKRIL